MLVGLLMDMIGGRVYSSIVLLLLLLKALKSRFCLCSLPHPTINNILINLKLIYIWYHLVEVLVVVLLLVVLDHFKGVNVWQQCAMYSYYLFYFTIIVYVCFR